MKTIARSIRLRLLTLAAAILSLATLGASHARAQVTVYTTQAAYNAASGGNTTTYTFSGGQPGYYAQVTPSYTAGPLTFASQNLYLNNYGQYGNGVNNLASNSGPETITLSGAKALSFTLGTAGGAQTIAISINGTFAANVVETGGAPNTMFIGFTNSVPITSLTFTNASNPGSEVDVLSFQVPEPSTWALLGVGVAGLGVVTLRRRASAAGRA